MKPTLEQLVQRFSAAADLDELSGRQAEFLDLLEPDRAQDFSEEELSDEELALAAGGRGQGPDPAACANLIRPVRPGGLK